MIIVPNTDFDDSESDEEFVDATLVAAFPRRPQVYLHRKEYFLELRDDEFIDRFRMSKEAVLCVVDKIRRN